MADAEKIKFHRPQNDAEFGKLTAKEKDMISVKVLLGYSNAAAYGLFNPHLCDRSGKLNKAGQTECRMFFNHPNCIAYADALKAHLEELTKGAVKVSTTADGLTEERKDNATKLLILQLIKMIEDGKIDDPELMKLVTDLSVKVKLFKEEEEQVIKPIRVLMARCKSECRYRAFVETQVTEGTIFDDCAYCRARAYAEERGFVYDPCKLLDVPQEVIDEIDSKNKIRLEDILSGKIEN